MPRLECRAVTLPTPSGHHPTTLSGYIFATTIGKKLVKQQYLPYMSPQYGELRPTSGGPVAAEVVSLVWGTPANFNGFRVLAALLHGSLVVGVSQTAALNRGRHLYSAGRPSRWALAHISSFVCVSSSVYRILSWYLLTVYFDAAKSCSHTVFVCAFIS